VRHTGGTGVGAGDDAQAGVPRHRDALPVRRHHLGGLAHGVPGGGTLRHPAVDRDGGAEHSAALGHHCHDVLGQEDAVLDGVDPGAGGVADALRAQGVHRHPAAAAVGLTGQGSELLVGELAGAGFLALDVAIDTAGWRRS